MLRFYSLLESSTFPVDQLYGGQQLSVIEKSNCTPFSLVDISEQARSKNAIYWGVSPWVEKCFGKIVTIPDGISTPVSLDDMKELLQYADLDKAKIIIDWYGEKSSFTSPLRDEKSILLVKLEKLAYINKIEGSEYKFLLGPGVTAEKMNHYFHEHQIPLESPINFRGASTIYEFYLNYLDFPEDNIYLDAGFFLYLRVETLEGKFIVEEFNLNNKKNQKDKIRELLLSAGAPIGIISGIGIDFRSFVKNYRPETKRVFQELKNTKIDPQALSITHKDESINFSKDATIDLLKKEFKLTERESFVCCLLLEGHGDKAISNKLNISYWTVRTHVNKILEKLAISSRLEIAFKVLELYKTI